MPELSDAELLVLAWPASSQPSGLLPLPSNELVGIRTAEFRRQIDLGLVRELIDHLQAEIDRQAQSINQTRHELPKGWYRRTSPTVDLEVRSVSPTTESTVQLPRFWQLLAISSASDGKPIDPR